MTDLRASLAASLGDRFELGEELGGGGMSRLFLAHERGLGRTVVVKLLSPELSADIGVERFLREIRVLAGLQQANIVPLLHMGACGDTPWYTMPFVDGRSLRARLSDGPLPIAMIRDVLRDVVRALVYAHAHGVVHRDIKPDNVLLSGGTAVVTDFGIARALGVAQTTSEHRTLTKHGTSVGTPAYMAPEQIAGDETLDGRVDLYALGCMAYELLTGAPPFADRPPSQVFSAHLTVMPEPVERRRADTPPDLAALVSRCLAKDPADRPASAEDVLAMLSTASHVYTPKKSHPMGVSRRHLLLGVGAVALIAAGVFAARGTSPAASDGSVVVLPFRHARADSSHRYLADGLTEELIAGLARIDGIRVTARSLAQKFRGQEVDVRRVADAVGVAHVLSGTIAQSATGVHVVAELTRRDGSLIWTKTLDRDSLSLAGIESELIEATAQSLRVPLDAAARGALTQRAQRDPEAHDLYLRGRFFWSQRSEEGMRRAIDLYRESIDRQPNNTQALSGLADAYAVSAFYSYLSPDDGYGRAKQIARQALSLDSTLAEPNASLGYVALYYDWNFPDAQRLLRRAIALDSTYATAHQWYGNYHLAMGELSAAIAELRQAERLDPTNRISTSAHCWGLVLAHRPTEAVRQCQRGLELDSTLAVAWMWRGQALEQLRDTAMALASLETAVRFGHRSVVTVAALAEARASFGQVAGARTLLRELQSSTARYRPSYEIAAVYAALGEDAQALAYLQRAVDERSHSVVLLGVDPAFSHLRNDPRLLAIMRRVGLPTGVEQPQ